MVNVVEVKGMGPWRQVTWVPIPVLSHCVTLRVTEPLACQMFCQIKSGLSRRWSHSPGPLKWFQPKGSSVGVWTLRVDVMGPSGLSFPGLGALDPQVPPSPGLPGTCGVQGTDPNTNPFQV